MAFLWGRPRSGEMPYADGLPLATLCNWTATEEWEHSGESMLGSIRSRIWVSLAGVGAARLVTVAYNFFLVPILLTAWGVETYGEWVVLTAAATLVSMSNLGFLQASASEIIIRVTAGEQDKATKVFSTTVFSVMTLVIIVVSIASAILSTLDPRQAFGVTNISDAHARWIVGTVLTSLAVSFISGPIAAASGAIAGAGVPHGTMAAIKALELVAISVTALFGGRPIVVAGVLLFSQITTVGVLWFLMRRFLPWLKLSWAEFDKRTIARLLHPSLGQFLLYISVNLLVIQVPRIVVGQLSGPTAVALFSVSMTYVRAARTLTSFIAMSLQIELSRAYSEGNRKLLSDLVRATTRVGFWATLAAAIFLLVFAKPIFSIWTHDKIIADTQLVSLLVVATIWGAYGDTFQSLLIGINRMWLLAITHFMAGILGIAFGVAFYPSFGLLGMAGGLVIPEIATAIAGALVTCKLLGISPFRFALQSMKFPIALLRNEWLRTWNWARKVFSRTKQ